MDMIHLLSSIITLYGKFYLYLAAILKSYGLAILVLSILTSVLMRRPIRWANKITKKEREFQAVLLPQIKSIKAESSGSEQHARISALYKRYSYHPIFAVRLVTPLLIQLPFFILAYLMLDGLSDLDGKSFLFLSNLAMPDELVYGGNILPFAMTALNLAAALIVPDFSRKDLYQAVAVSLVFFLLLYDHSSALLLYWTMNNLIILLRNMVVYYKADKNQRINFKLLWRKFILLMMSYDVLLFLIIFLIYILLLRSLLFTSGYNLSLSSALRMTLILGIIFLAITHLIIYTKKIWKKQNLSIRSIQQKIQRINNKIILPFPQVSLGDCVLILIPLAPLFQYLLLNDYLMPFGNRVFLICVGAAILFMAIITIPFVLQKYLPVTGLVPLNVTLAYIYLSMPGFSLMFKWTFRPDLPLLAAILVMLFSALFLLYVKRRKLLYFIAFIFFIVSLMHSMYIVHSQQKTEEASLYPYHQISTIMRDSSNFIPTGSMKKKPDIYLLTYDAYVGQETMNQYGIDNSAQEEYLMDNGFKIYKRAYTVSTFSENSMSKVLGMLGGERMLPFSVANDGTSGKALVVDILKDQGYKTYSVTSYPQVSLPIEWDDNFPEIPTEIGPKMLLYGLQFGKFVFDIDTIEKFLNYEEIDAKLVGVKREVLSAQTSYPKFMYSHSFYPEHGQLSGKCMPDEIESFKERLQISNEEMKGDIETILASKRDAIIIVNGDHGPYLTGDCSVLKGYSIEDISQLYLQDRIGTFLAIRWPDESYKQYDDIRILQDTFESIFKFLFETNQVLRRRPNTSTLGENGIARGFVIDGKIMLGKDKGKPLFNDTNET